MKTLVFLMSMNGEMSVTLHSTRYIQDVYAKTDSFEEVLLPKNGILPEGVLEKFKEADLIMFSTSMYHFMIASQAMEAMNAIGTYLRENGVTDKPVTYFMTSNFLMDVLVHRYIESWANRYSMRYIKGISIFSDDAVEDKYRADMFAWFNNVKALALSKDLAVRRDMNTRLVLLDTTEKTAAIAAQYEDAFEKAGSLVKKVNMCEYDFKHCLGCQACYTTRECCIKDQFNQLANDIEAGADAIIYIGTVENGFYPPVFKRFMDRHVCMGRCPIDDEKVVLFSYQEGESFAPHDLETLKMWATSYTSFGGEVLTGIYREFDMSGVNAAVAAFNENIAPYRDFYRAALFTRFGELARVIRNIEPLDYAYFKSQGAYAIPPVNTNCRPILSMDDAKKSIEMKAMPVRMYRTQHKDLSVPIPERRKDKGRSLVERATHPSYAPDGYANVDLSDDKSQPAAPPSGAAMGKMMGKVGHRMGLLMNTFNTILFSTIGTLNSGHFTWGGWLFGAAVGWCTGAVITSIIPVKDTQDWVLEKTKTDGKSLKGRLLASLSTNLIIMPAMTIVMGLAMPNLSAMNLENGIKQTEAELAALQIQQCELKLDQSNLKTEQSDLKLQQAELKLEQAVLQGQYDTMEMDIEWLQKSIENAASPAEKGALNGQLESKQAALAEMQAGIEEMQGGINGMQEGIDGKQGGIDEMQQGIDGMQEGIDGMTTSITERKNAVNGIRAAIPKSLPISAILNTIIGIIFGLFTQPFFTKLMLKSVFGKNAPKE